MPKQLTQYRVFIGSPGGLDEERICFQSKLVKYSALNAEHRGVLFHPVGWEDTTSGVGRPQALINEDLKQCDYAVFVLHDRWGSPTGGGYTSGTEEEWALAEELYKANTIRNIALFFKRVDQRQIKDPGKQLKAVLSFKKWIEDRKQYLFKHYETIEQFAEALEAHLSRWLRDHEGTAGGLSASGLITGGAVPISNSASSPIPVASPGFDYWIMEADKLLEAEASDHTLFCAEKAVEVVKSDIEWARARNVGGIAQFRLGKLDAAIAAFTAIAERFSSSIDADRRYWLARALVNQGITLGALDRSADAIAVYDDMLARFGTASELPLREQVATALVNKGVRLGALARSAEALAVYDDVLARFGTASELPLREQVAKALFNKIFILSVPGISEEAIAVCDDVIKRFGNASELPLREQVAKALLSKGLMLGVLGRSEEEIAAYDDVVKRFGEANEPSLREIVADAKIVNVDASFSPSRSSDMP